jgi:hypothetical protein
MPVTVDIEAMGCETLQLSRRRGVSEDPLLDRGADGARGSRTPEIDRPGSMPRNVL